MWYLALLPVFPLHSFIVHTVMNNVAPFYQAFDTFTQHSWVGRATSLATQLAVLPAYAMGNMSFFHHTLGLYIVADMVHMSMYLRRDTMAWIHHVATLGSYVLTTFLPPNVTETLLYGTMLLELSSPLVHLSWFLNKAGYSAHWWFKYLAGTTLVNYFVTRCVLFPRFVIYDMPSYLWAIGFIFVALNFIWFLQLVRYARRATRKEGGSRTV